MSKTHAIEELVSQHWGLRGPYTTRQLRDEPYRLTWWMQTRDGTVMIKWFGDPGREDTVVSALRLVHWAAQQGVPLSQLIMPRSGPEHLRFGDGVCVMFEYIDGAMGVNDWGALGRSVARLHTLTPPEFAERSPVAPRTGLASAHRSLRAYLETEQPDEPLADTISRTLDLLRELPVYADAPAGLIHGNLGIGHTITRASGEIAFLDTLDIGIGPFSLDFTPILCEHLSHLGADGIGERLDIDAARVFFREYEKIRPIPDMERGKILHMQQAFIVAKAARELDQSRYAGSAELQSRARTTFRWLEYVCRMVEHDLPQALDR